MIRKVFVVLFSLLFIGCSSAATAQPTVEVNNTAFPDATFQPAFTPTITFTPPPTSTPLPIPTMIPIDYPYVEDIVMDPSCVYTLRNVYTGDSAILQFTSFSKKEHISVYGQRTINGEATIHYQTNSEERDDITLTCRANNSTSCVRQHIIRFPSRAVILFGYQWKPPVQAPYYLYGQNADIYLTLPTGWDVQTDCK